METFILQCVARQRDDRPANWDDAVGICPLGFHRLTGQPAVLDFAAHAMDAGELVTAGYSLSQLGGHGVLELTGR